MQLKDAISISDPLTEGDIRFLLPGTEIEVLDSSPGAPEGGAWLDSRIRQRLVYKAKDGRSVVTYETSAPWTYAGTTDVEVDDFGRTWRLKE